MTLILQCKGSWRLAKLGLWIFFLSISWMCLPQIFVKLLTGNQAGRDHFQEENQNFVDIFILYFHKKCVIHYHILMIFVIKISLEPAVCFAVSHSRNQECTSTNLCQLTWDLSQMFFLLVIQAEIFLTLQMTLNRMTVCNVCFPALTGLCVFSHHMRLEIGFWFA